MTKAAVETDQRRSRRRPVYMKASISHSTLSEGLDCIVREISQDGARLELPHAKDLPLAFLLRLDGETALRLCTTAWHSDNQVGVEFSQQIIERNAQSRTAVLNFHTA
ncbi:MAG TPA: PilZ domain-containing protein [Aestuariivirga sp.]|nr:PilZ domain-containing protein [Aestuariivirga sp.]